MNIYYYGLLSIEFNLTEVSIKRLQSDLKAGHAFLFVFEKKKKLTACFNRNYWGGDYVICGLYYPGFYYTRVFSVFVCVLLRSTVVNQNHFNIFCN